MNRIYVYMLMSCLAAASLHASEPAGDGPEDLRRQVELLRNEVADLKRARDLDYKILSDRFDRMEKLLERIAGEGGISRSGFTPTTPAPESATGIIRLDNRLPVTGYVTIDGVSYRVPPLATRTLRSMPIGAIQYTLGADGMSTGPVTRSRVNAGEMLTITLLPPG
jgi:hypothetical protein